MYVYICMYIYIYMYRLSVITVHLTLLFIHVCCICVQVTFLFKWVMRMRWGGVRVGKMAMLASFRSTMWRRYDLPVASHVIMLVWATND